MLLRALLALPLLAAALPATAQTKLAQQCAAFGEAQYRKLSPSVDRVTALDFPPPALERVDAKVGSQAIAAALTLRGRLTYHSGSPFETQFVCLLDAGQRPIFFYALPTLATRSAPTPVTRGAAPAPVPPLQPPAEAPTPSGIARPRRAGPTIRPRPWGRPSRTKDRATPPVEWALNEQRWPLADAISEGHSPDGGHSWAVGKFRNLHPLNVSAKTAIPGTRLLEN